MPITASRFGISVDGHEIASFSELQGITTEVKPVEYLPGTLVAPIRAASLLSQHSGTRTPSTIRLRRPRDKDVRLTAWHTSAARKNASLILYDQGSKPVARYRLVNAWPSKIQVAGASAGTAMESITISVERIERVSG
jgi:phage tail-like protein